MNIISKLVILLGLVNMLMTMFALLGPAVAIVSTPGILVTAWWTINAKAKLS